MSSDKPKSLDYLKVTPGKNGRDGNLRDYNSLTFSDKKKKSDTTELQTFSSKKKTADDKEIISVEKKSISPENLLPASEKLSVSAGIEETSYADLQKQLKNQKKRVRDKTLLENDNWLMRNGHTVTYVFLYLFSVFVFFRPYELLPQLSFLQTGAFVLALATLLFYLPAQFVTEGSITILTTEVKCILVLIGLALLTMPISKDFSLAWKTFNDTFIKAVLMFIVMVNVLRTRRRLLGIIWISLGISLYLSYTAFGMYMRGELRGDGYRVMNEFGGMLNNPNDWALHLVTMIPLVVCLGLAAKNHPARIIYFLMGGLFVAAVTITYSRGGFLGLVAVVAVLVWKIGRKQRLKTTIIAAVIGLIFILLAPGNYGMRLLSIFIPGIGDDAGSSDQRKENLILSIIVTLRNPWGIGIGCSPTFGVRNLQTHNAYTQVSSELGLAGLAAYLIFIVSPFRKLAAIERTLLEKDESGWLYYMSIGLQASLAGYMVSSFFGSVAYNWFIYYLAAYAVAFRRIYSIEKGEED